SSIVRLPYHFDWQSQALEIRRDGIPELIGEANALATRCLIAKYHAHRELCAQLICGLISSPFVLDYLQILLVPLRLGQVEPAQPNSRCYWLFQKSFRLLDVIVADLVREQVALKFDGLVVAELAGSSKQIVRPPDRIFIGASSNRKTHVLQTLGSLGC